MARDKLVLADIHVGEKTDFVALRSTVKRAIEKLRRYGVSAIDLMLLGDIHEGQDMYPTQVELMKGRLKFVESEKLSLPSGCTGRMTVLGKMSTS